MEVVKSKDFYMMLKFSSFILGFILSSSVFAKRFANGYTEFELPKGWNCAIEGSEWVCQSENQDRQKEAIIILAAKKRGPQDTLGEYQKYLNQPKTYQLPGSKLQRSEPKTVKTNMINGQQWIDALHLASEIPGFYTRYLATVKADIGVAVTFSVTKSMYNAYKGIFDGVIASMRVFRQANTNLAGLKKEGQGSEGFAETTFIPGSENLDISAGGVKPREKKSGGSDDLMLIGLAVVVGAFVLMKMKGGKKKTKKKKSKNA